MKTALSLLLFLYFLPVNAYTIVTIDQTHPTKEQVIEEVLEIQRSLIIPLEIPIPEKNAKSGYLLIEMTPDYVNNLLTTKDGIIVCAYQDQTLIGYILLIDISEFKELYEDEEIGYIETSLNLARLSKPNVGYIEQIGVKPGYTRRGVGSALVQASQELKPDGLVADVFLEPLENRASLSFFSNRGFEKVGLLYQHPRWNFPHAHCTQVFFWTHNGR